MGEYVEFTFDDGQTVLLEVFPSPLADSGAGGATPGSAPLVPVAGEGNGRVGRAARGALRQVLKPLVPVLQSVHETVSAMDRRPQQLTVDLGVKVGNDLTLGIVANKGEASLTVSATWNLEASVPTE
ncbi:CU044_2847 family protein [Streptomyces doebereineriae]|uniref:CU044_2847 family protein n=1 Tax=Streptomyces doebereineriae TaxID=3075528 RepID=A0ABU2V2J6_9ACTN|nr:CU044_2847 family protein [Streptomyces sp. DSM 41640]MDT0479762.1 CU044_2847 family protein [Streptomyces sp. DSM 41640]